jgi:hypothetical protein
MGLSAKSHAEKEVELERKEGPTHHQYGPETVGAVCFLKYCGERFKKKLHPPAHRQQDIIEAPLTASQVIFQPNKNDNGLTFMPAPSPDMNFLEKIKKISLKTDHAQAKLKEIMLAQILRLSGYEPDSNEAFALRGTLEASKFFDKGIVMKIGSFFLELFKIDKKHAIENKKKGNGRKDTIIESAGVYPIIRTVQAPEGFIKDRSDPFEAGATLAIDSLFAGALQYAKDLSYQGGYHPNADRDPSLNPQTIQTSANNFFTHVRQHGFASLFVEKRDSAKIFDKRIQSSQKAQKILDASSRCLADPDTDLIPDEQSVGEVRFHADSPILTPDRKGLEKISVRVFSLDHKHYRNANMAEIGERSPHSLTEYLSPIIMGKHDRWKPIEEMADDPIRPVFALSITKNGDTPRGLIDNAGLNGESLVHYDFRVNDDGTVVCITHHGHVRQDGGNAAVYSNLQEAVLPPVIPDSSPTVMELAPLYRVTENPQNAKELLTLLGLSDMAVGEGYDKAGLDEKIKTINEWYNEAFSKQIFDTVTLELQDNVSVDTFITSLATEHPQVDRRQNLYLHKLQITSIEIPPAANELELLLDNLHTIKDTNFLIQEHFAQLKKEKNDLFAQIPVSLKPDQATNPDQLLKILSDNYPVLKDRIKLHGQKKNPIPDPRPGLETLVDELVTFKKHPDFKTALSNINSTASLVRNLLSPNISEVHLFDMVLSAKGGVVNCTLPLFDYLRLETSIVKRSPFHTLIPAYQKLTTSEQKQQFIEVNKVGLASLFADLEVNLLDQTLSRLGLPTAGFLLERAGGAADLIKKLAEFATPGVVPVSRNAYVQTSFVAGLGKFISALQSDMPEENLAVSCTDDGKGNGYLCYRANLAKPESSDLYLNMLDINNAINKYNNKSLNLGGLAPEIATFTARHLSISAEEQKKGVTLNQKLDAISKIGLTEKQRKALKEILTIALQQDLHHTIGRTQSLAEMLELYSKQAMPTI